MQPLQVWLPLFDPTLSFARARRDLERAMRSWRGSATVWITPWSEEERDWTVPSQPLLGHQMVPGENPDRIDVYFIGQKGFVFGRAPWFGSTAGRLRRLLKAWLSVGRDDAQNRITHGISPPTVGFLAPRIRGEEIVFAWLDILNHQPVSTTEAGLSESASPPTEEDPTVVLETRWPPDGQPRRQVISPAAESRAYYGNWDRETAVLDGVEVPTLVSQKVPGARSLPTVDIWPGLLRRFFPVGAGADANLANRQMKEIAAASSRDPEGALTEARNYSTQHLTTGSSPRWNAYYVPMLSEHGEQEVLADLELKHDLSFNSLRDALDNPEVNEVMSELIPVRQALGPLGLFWALLIEELEAGRVYRRCEHCGGVIQGQASKRFCSQSESRACWRKRRNADRRRERAKSKKR